MRSELTPGELNILRCAAAGMDQPETAFVLSISIEAVKRFRYWSRMKLGAANVTQAVAMAIRQGLID